MIETNVPLKIYSNYKIGGTARYFLNAKKIDHIEKALKNPFEKIFTLGEGTNILFGDEDFNGLIIKPNFQYIKKEDGSIRVGAGILMRDLVDYFVSKGLSGLEWAGGLPGTVGGAVYGNAGSFGGEMKDIVKEVVSLDISGKKN